MNTQDIWDNFNEELYFFILKKVNSKHVANDIFQNSFLKIHQNLSKLKSEEKVKAWIFQIARNEIITWKMLMKIRKPLLLNSKSFVVLTN